MDTFENWVGPSRDQTDEATRTETKREQAALYLRVSQEKNEDSLIAHKRVCLEYAASRGYSMNPKHVFEEGVFTGESLFERPALRALLETMERGEFKVIVLFALDRFARVNRHLSFLFVQAEAAGVRIESPTERIDSSNEGWFVRGVKGYVSEEELKKIRLRTSLGRDSRRAGGDGQQRRRGYSGGRPLWGYQWHDDPSDKKYGKKSDYSIIPEGVPGHGETHVKRIFQDCLDGKPLRSIAVRLERDHIPSPMGKVNWTPSSVRHVLKNPGYAGMLVESLYRNYFDRTKGRKVTKERDRSEWRIIYGVIPPMVSMVAWDAAQQILTGNKAKAPHKLANPEDFLVRGYVFCSVCNDAMWAKNITKKGRATPERRVYVCSGYHHIKNGDERRVNSRSELGGKLSISQPTLDAAVWGNISALLDNPERVRRQINRMIVTDPAVVDIERIDRAIREVSRLIDNLKPAPGRTDNDLARQILMDQLNQADCDLQGLQEERDELVTRRQDRLAGQAGLNDLAAFLMRPNRHRRSSVMPYKIRRVALNMLALRVVVYPSKASGNGARRPVWIETRTEQDGERCGVLVNTSSKPIIAVLL